MSELLTWYPSIIWAVTTAQVWQGTRQTGDYQIDDTAVCTSVGGVVQNFLSGNIRCDITVYDPPV